MAEMLIVKKLKVKILKTPSHVWFGLNKRHLILSVHCIFSSTYIFEGIIILTVNFVVREIFSLITVYSQTI